MMVDDSSQAIETRIKIFSNIIYKHPVRAIIQTTEQKIYGDVHVRPDNRLRDELNTGEPFLAVTDATIYDRDGKILYQAKFLAVSVSQIIWLLPENEIQDDK